MDYYWKVLLYRRRVSLVPYLWSPDECKWWKMQIGQIDLYNAYKPVPIGNGTFGRGDEEFGFTFQLI